MAKARPNAAKTSTIQREREDIRKGSCTTVRLQVPVQKKSGGHDARRIPVCVFGSSYWIGVPPEAANGSVGAVPPVSCQIVLPAFTANERVPVVPNVCGMPVA